MKNRLLLLLILGAAEMAVAAELPAYTPDANAPRSAVPDLYKWNLAPLFASDQAFDDEVEVLLQNSATNNRPLR